MPGIASLAQANASKQWSVTSGQLRLITDYQLLITEYWSQTR